MDEKQSKQPTKGLQVIGSGLPRTGTTSLKVAFDILGFGPCHHFKDDVVDEPFPYSNGKLWQQACNTKDRKERQRILHQIYEKGGHNSATDYPTSLFVEDLVEMYPDAKFIHCERSSAQVWRDSINETIGRTQRIFYRIPSMLIPVFAFSLRPTLAAMDARAKRTLGGAFYGPRTDMDLYYAHNEHVKQVVPKDRLLELDVKDGFKPLCDFLGLPVPKDDQGKELAFPHVNDRQHITKVMNRFVVVGWSLYAVTFVGLFLALKRWDWLPAWTKS